MAEFRAAGGSADAAQADLSMPEGAATLAKQVRAIVDERLDIFVSNAGVSKAATMKEHTIEDFDNLFATNVRSPFFLVKELLPLLGEGSSIIVVSSLGSYCTRQSWATGRAITPCLRSHERSPGIVGEALGCDARTARHPRQCRRSGSDRNGHVSFHEDRGGPRLHSRHAGVKRIGQPSDVADVIAFLASDARWITGASIPVDGGSKLCRGEFRCGYFRHELSRVAYKTTGESFMSQTKQEKNKALVLEAFDTLFNKRDHAAAERYWSPH